MNRYSVENTELILQLPLKTRGRPKVRKMNHNRLKNSRFLYGNSNLAHLYSEKKITPEQFNAGESFLWILHKVKKNIPIPRLAKSTYQERIEGIMWDLGLKNEKNQKEIFRWWRASILVLKEAGGTTKNLLENFVWNNDSPHTLSEVELQLIKRGLDRLALLYNEAPADENLP